MVTPWTSNASRQVLTLEKRTSIASLWPAWASITSSLPAHFTGTLSTDTDRRSAHAFVPASPDRFVWLSEVRNVIAESTYGRAGAASVFGSAGAAVAVSAAGLGASAFGAASFVVDCARATFAASRKQNASLLKSRIEIPPGKRLNGSLQRDGTIAPIERAMCADVGRESARGRAAPRFLWRRCSATHRSRPKRSDSAGSRRSPLAPLLRMHLRVGVNMKWLRWSTVAVSLVPLCLVIGLLATFRFDVELAVQNQVEPMTPPIPSLDQALDQLDLVSHGIVAPTLLLHRLGRSAAVQADHRIPAALVGSGEILDQSRDLDPLLIRHVGARAEHFREPAGRRRVVVLVGARQRHDQPAGNVMGEAVHVVDLRREQQLADVREDRLGYDVTGRILLRVDRGGHAAGVEALDDLDQLDHRLPEVWRLVG